MLEAGRREILDAVGAGGDDKGRMVVLTALLRLRQICCDLRLLKTGGPAAPSGKVEMFGELLEEVLDGGHRALVFSQFTSMLALLRQDLSAQNIDFCYLDGATADRARVVEQFQRESAIPVFLISLKAGGVGLNLTGADTVIHFDPWWNPAVEGAGGRPRPPHWPDEGGDQLQAHHPRDGGGKNPGLASPQTRADAGTAGGRGATAAGAQLGGYPAIVGTLTPDTRS